MQIKNFAKIEYLIDFELTKHEGQHSHLRFTASIEDNTEESCLACVGNTISVIAGKLPIFYGRVEVVEVERTVNAVRAYVSCISLSISTDEKSKTRIFHNPDKKIADVIDKSRLSLENCELRLNSEFSTRGYKNVILQNQETNFSFMRRISKNLNQRLWIIDTMPQAEILIDDCIDKSSRIINENQIISVRRIKNGKISQMKLKSQNYFEIGSVVKVETDSKDVIEYVIIGLRSLMEDESYFFNYDLIERNIKPQGESDEPILAKTVKLNAKVTKVDDPKNFSRIQVKFVDKFVEDMDEKNPLWVPYRSPYSGKEGGIVFLPDEGDSVEVFFTNEEIYATSTFRNSALAEECQRVINKYIGNNFKQRIFWKEKSLEFFSDKYKIIMNEKGIELTVEDNSIFITKDGILLNTKNSCISIADDVAIKTNNKFETKSKDTEVIASSKVKINGSENSIESSGAVNVQAGGTLKLIGSKIELC